MRLTTKGRYAVTAMLDLALHSATGPVTLADIAARQGISQSYLEQLFGKLKRARLVQSLRGPGRRLRADAIRRAASTFRKSSVGVGEGIDATRCGGSGDCQDGLVCITHDLWMDLSRRIDDFLSDITLGSLLERGDVQSIARRQDALVGHERHDGRLIDARVRQLIAPSMRKPIYLDYSATTPVDPRVAQKMSDCLLTDGNFGNPSSRSHVYGWQAEEAVEEARTQVAKLLNCDPREIVWTSGATESDNLAIKGVAEAQGASRRHIVTSVDRTQSGARYLRVSGNQRVRSDVPAAGRVRHRRARAGCRRAARRTRCWCR